MSSAKQKLRIFLLSGAFLLLVVLGAVPPAAAGQAELTAFIGEYHATAVEEGTPRYDVAGLLDYLTPERYRIEERLRNDLSSAEAARAWEELRSLAASGQPPLRWERLTDGSESVADYQRYALIGRPRLMWALGKPDEWIDPTLTQREPPRVSILMYHDIRPHSNYSTVITPGQFERQVRYLAENGYTFITISQLLDAVYSGGEGLPERCVALTFDDGWSGVYDYAYPVLKRYGGTATLYVYTNYVDRGGRTISWDQYREMLAAGFEVGSHTVSHCDLTDRETWDGSGTKPPAGRGSYTDRLMHELVDSKLILEEKLGIEVRSLALPYGCYDSYVLKSALLAGYEGVLTIRQANTYVDANTNELELHRWNIVPSLTLGQFIARLER